MVESEIQIILHKSWASLVEHCDKEGKVISVGPQVNGDAEPNLTEIALFILAVDASLPRALDEGRPAWLMVAPEWDKEFAGRMAEDNCPEGCQTAWARVRNAIQSGDLKILDPKSPPTAEHVRIRSASPTRWASHLDCGDGTRIDLSGSLEPGTYTKAEGQGTVTVEVLVTASLLQVAALRASLDAALTRQSRIIVLANTALNGALRVSWRDWERALHGPLSTTIAVAFPWLLGALESLRLGLGTTYEVRWLTTE